MDKQISFRPLTRSDFDILHQWLNSSAVKEWWPKPATPESIEKKYGSRVDGKEPVDCFVILVDGVPIGLVQSWWVKDYPEYAKVLKLPGSISMDWLIGNEDYLGKGFGPIIAQKFGQLVAKKYPDAHALTALPSIHNQRSIRALEKAGFKKEHVLKVPDEDDPAQLFVLDLN